MTKPRTCRKCGCSRANPCQTAIGPCAFLAPDLCFACSGVVAISDEHRDGTPCLVADAQGNFASAFWTGNMWAFVLPGTKPVQQTDFTPTHIIRHPEMAGAGGPA